MKLFTASLTACLILSGHVLAHPEHKNKNSAKTSAQPSQAVTTGNGLFLYETVPGWGKMPEGKNIGPTHGGVAVGSDGTVYVSTDAGHGVCVFQADGTFVKSLGKKTSGLHSLVVKKEGNQEYLYGAQGKQNRAVKFDLDGKLVFQIPNEQTGELPHATESKTKEGKIIKNHPFKGITAVAVADSGEVFIACGYGSNYIFKFDAEGKYLKSFGGRSQKGAPAPKNKFRTCHGLAIDQRFGEPRLLVVDRENGRLMHFTLDFEFISQHSRGLRRPCAVSFHGNNCAVAELAGRAVVLDKQGVIVSILGDNPNVKQRANFGIKKKDMQTGIFTAPHGLSYDAKGNIIVQDWNKFGRVTMLRHKK